MENHHQIQECFFRQVRELIPSHLSLVDEISELLNISNDSAYRRIRGEKLLTLDELGKLCEYFRISLDSVLDLKTDTITFHSYMLKSDSFLFGDYLTSIRDDMRRMDLKALKEVVIIFNEIHFFLFIQVPEVAAFKFYFWMKSHLGHDSVKDLRFSARDIDENIMQLCNDITEMYVMMPTTELLTSEALCSFIKQIKYYYESGYFATDEDAAILFDRLGELVCHMRIQSELGIKYPFGKDQKFRGGAVSVYCNDLLLSDNTIMVDMGGHGVVYITANLVNLFFTSNQVFFESNMAWKNNLEKRSTLISGTAERERNRFFRDLEDQLSRARKEVLG